MELTTPEDKEMIDVFAHWNDYFQIHRKSIFLSNDYVGSLLRQEGLGSGWNGVDMALQSFVFLFNSMNFKL